MMRLVALALVATVLAGCSDGETTNDILGQAAHFDGGDRTVALGELVTFRMISGSHTVDFAEGEAAVAGVSDAHSGNLDEGDTWQVTFSEPGVYPYFCRYHSGLQDGERIGMVGTITVA